MQAIIWLISGLLAGWLARIVMKGRKSGFVGDVTLGILGGVIGAWMLGSTARMSPSITGANSASASAGLAPRLPAFFHHRRKASSC